MLVEGSMQSMKFFGYRLYHIVFYFIIYSFVGWFIETSYVWIDTGSYQSRGFLYGPFCIIYGFGALLLILFLKPKTKNMFSFFLGSVMLTSAIEYMTGYILDKELNMRLWDYRGLFLNINGYVALKSSLFWGLLSILLIYCLQQRLDKIIMQIPIKIAVLFSYVIIIFFILNSTLSIASVIRPL